MVMFLLVYSLPAFSCNPVNILILIQRGLQAAHPSPALLLDLLHDDGRVHLVTRGVGSLQSPLKHYTIVQMIMTFDLTMAACY